MKSTKVQPGFLGCYWSWRGVLNTLGEMLGTLLLAIAVMGLISLTICILYAVPFFVLVRILGMDR